VKEGGGGDGGESKRSLRNKPLADWPDRNALILSRLPPFHQKTHRTKVFNIIYDVDDIPFELFARTVPLHIIVLGVQRWDKYHTSLLTY
jgi:hypothetical protein